jgi:hypothetical protein
MTGASPESLAGYIQEENSGIPVALPAVGC